MKTKKLILIYNKLQDIEKKADKFCNTNYMSNYKEYAKNQQTKK